MKTPKIKRYRLSVSRNFPSTHPREGKETYFVEKISCGCHCPGDCGVCDFIQGKKLHTIRANYDLWAKRMAEVQAGRAVLELFYWEDKPYRSKQVVFATLDEDSGCGVQELIFENFELDNPYEFDGDWQHNLQVSELAKNDGLSLEDFKAWFKGYDLSKPMAIIHLTEFRY